MEEKDGNPAKQVIQLLETCKNSTVGYLNRGKSVRFCAVAALPGNGWSRLRRWHSAGGFERRHYMQRGRSAKVVSGGGEGKGRKSCNA